MKPVITTAIILSTLSTVAFANDVDDCMDYVFKNDWYYQEKAENKDLMRIAGTIILDEVESICEYHLNKQVTSVIWGWNPKLIKMMHDTTELPK